MCRRYIQNIRMKVLPIYILLLELVLPSQAFKRNGSISSIPVLTGMDRAYLGSKVAFQCKAADSSPPVTFRLLRDTDVLATVRHLQADKPATFVVKVNVMSAGSYQCTVTTEGKTEVSNSIKLLLLRTRIKSEPNPPVLYEGSRLVLSCNVTGGTHDLSYTWFFNLNKVTPSTLPPLQPTGSKLVVEEVTSQHAGVYSCMTETRLNRSSTSWELRVVVKEKFSNPRITSAISKEGDGYHINVTCWTSSGSLPATFCFLLDDTETSCIIATESMVASFSVSMVPGRDMGMARCLVKSEVQELKSEPLTLAVELVGGPVQVEVKYLYGADFQIDAARLLCHPSRGTFPSFSWILNNSVLPIEVLTRPNLESLSPHYALADSGRALILTKMDPGLSGHYRCRVRDSFDDSSPWFESPAVWVQMIEATLMTIEVISISFCCFLLLTLAVGSACLLTRRSDCQRAGVSLHATTNSNALHLTAVTSRSESQ